MAQLVEGRLKGEAEEFAGLQDSQAVPYSGRHTDPE